MGELELNIKITKTAKVKVVKKTNDLFEGSYKDETETIEIKREGYNRFYILVYSDSGYSYEGYWDAPKVGITDIEDAIKEALIGSDLVN